MGLFIRKILVLKFSKIQVYIKLLKVKSMLGIWLGFINIHEGKGLLTTGERNDGSGNWTSLLGLGSGIPFYEFV